MDHASPKPFTRAQIAFHWATALLVVLMAVTGMMYFLEIADGAAIRAHQVAGQVLIVILAARLIVKLRAPARGASDHAVWEKALAGAVQVALYFALITAAVTGYVSASAFANSALLLPVDIGFARSDAGARFLTVHYAMKWVFLGLVGLHVAGALKHHFIDRDATLRHMVSSQE
ncbi:MAG: cytochrome b/b6 domain-containing protein [Pseudomonadota bacterium]